MASTSRGTDRVKMQVAAVWEAYYTDGDWAGELARLRKLNLHWYRTTKAEIDDMIDDESECY